MSGVNTVCASDPGYIRYLLNPELKYKCYFLVGNPSLNMPVKRIGVVKKMLMANSEVLRWELRDSKLAEKEYIICEDLCPETFQNMLRFVYGFDRVSTLTFDETNNLLYAADKYMISSLKDKVAEQLMSLLTYENICSLMNNPACYRGLHLNREIIGILQYETDKVLASPLFPQLSPDGFLKLLEQESLNVPELEIWRAALNWAKHRADSQDAAVLRRELTPHLSLIRVCTLSLEDFVQEVVPARVLTGTEVQLVCSYHGTKEEQPELTEISRRTDPRPRLVKSKTTVILRSNFTDRLKDESLLTLTTKERPIKLSSVEIWTCYSRQKSHNKRTFHCEGTVEIIHITGEIDKGDWQVLTTAKFSEDRVNFIDWLLRVNLKKNVRLEANSKYVIRVSFTLPHLLLNLNELDYDNFLVNSGNKEKNGTTCSTHIKHLHYTIMTRVKSSG